MGYLLAFSVGVFTSALWPRLPSISLTLVLLSVAAIISLVLFRAGCRRSGGLLLSVAIGISYGLFYGHWLLQQQLPSGLDRATVRITGSIVGLPVSDSQSVRFKFLVQSVSRPEHRWLAGKTLRLGWYQQVTLMPGEQWQLVARLKRPRGLVNPGGFDYKAWLLRQGIAATGYIRDSGYNSRLALPTQISFDRLRWLLRQRTNELPLSDTAKGLVTALTIGDGSLLSQDTWRTFARAGIIHLLIISGLHIGLAAFFGYGLGFGLGRLLVLFLPATNAVYCAALGSLLTATCFALLSGMGLPAQRALVMIAVVALVVMQSRNIQRGAGFTVALAAIAISDPLAVESAGFWLSFAAVAVLIWLLPRGNKRAGLVTAFFHTQWRVFLALSGLLIFWQLPQSLLSPAVNLVAIPWVSFLVVPLCLLGALLSPFFPGVSDGLWLLSGWQLELLVKMVQALPDWPVPSPGVNGSGFVAVLAISLYLAAPKGLPTRYPAIVLMVALVVSQWADRGRPPLEITVLDVGQGLAVVVHAGRHTLVYDTGARFSERFEAGGSIVAPFLKWGGHNSIDALIVSHGDSDHAGGVSGLLSQLDAAEILAGEASRLGGINGVSPCKAGMHWRWEKVSFSILSPEEDFPPRSVKSNNRSCVLLIEFGNQRILLPGDIESRVEAELLAMYPDRLQSISLLIAPHHGSRTSSSWPFLKRLAPRYVVFSAGYKHHFRHPNDAVVSRYLELGSRSLLTADSGAITFRWDNAGGVEISEARHSGRRYWH